MIGGPAVLAHFGLMGRLDGRQRRDALDAAAERVDAEVAQLLHLLAALLLVKALRCVRYGLGGLIGRLGLIHGVVGQKV